jgi:hypothetical protein
MADIKARILLRRGTAAEWTAANPVLLDGEPAWETDTGNLRIGDGTTAFTSLPAYPLEQSFTAIAAAANGAAAKSANLSDLADSDAALENLGLTATTDELNILDGATVSTEEVNHLDGVTSPIQAQLDSKTGSILTGTGLSVDFVDGSLRISGATQDIAAWEAGTGTQEGVLSPAKVKAAVEALSPAQIPPTTPDVLSAIAGATAGAVGTYGFFQVVGDIPFGTYGFFQVVGDIPFGTTRAGSSLEPSNSRGTFNGSSPAGTWRCLGFADTTVRDEDSGPDTVYTSATLWLRIS